MSRDIARVQARRELNHSVLDPMARLPLELQSHIFLCVEHKSNFERKADPHDVPVVFLNVCHLWHVIALSTPKLWTEIKIDSLPRSTNYITLYKNWMERTGTLPLSLLLGGFLDSKDTFGDLVKQHQDQVQSLTLRWKLPSYPHPNNGKSVIYIQRCFPSLQKLAIYAKGNDVYASEEVLNEEEDLLDSVPLTLTSLEELRLGQPQLHDFRSKADVAILQYLSLPALRKLSLTFFGIDSDVDVVVSFFNRSSLPLESFSLSLGHVWPEGFAKRCLRSLPTLTVLELCSQSNEFSSFVTILGTSFNLFPNLRALSLATFDTVAIDYTAVLQMLNMRRSTLLRKFQVYLEETLL
ncbi:F-box domain-containing protein, partial [Favolaschia claudopus]